MSKLGAVVLVSMLVACGDGSAERKKLATKLEDVLRKGTGVAVKVTLRGEGDTVLVLQGIADACDPVFLAQAFSDNGASKPINPKE